MSDWSDIICETGSLGGVSPDKMVYLEITLNYPNTKTFRESLTHRQKERYSIIWSTYTSCVKKLHGMELMYDTYVYEACKSGKIHIHGILILHCKEKHFISGLISDITKLILISFPKSVKFNDKCMDKKYNKYMSPAIVVKYETEPDRLSEWLSYMCKEEFNKRYESQFRQVLKIYTNNFNIYNKK